MRVPILQGAYADAYANFRSSLPINMEPVITSSGLSEGYLRSAPGIEYLATGPGADRGSISWNEFQYRVMGSKLVRLSGPIVTVLGDVGNDAKPVSFDYSTSLLAICSAGKLFYWDGAALNQVVDPDLGVPIDVMFIDGYFMTTDGIYLVVTELADPYAVNPLKYGTADADPDNTLAVARVRNEAYAIGRFSIENFQNIGGSGFPFRRNPGGMIPKGAVGTHAWSYFLDTFAFAGSGRNEAPSVWLAGFGEATCISTPEIDREIAAVPWDSRSLIEVEAVQEEEEQRLYVHLLTKTLVYSHQATLANKAPVWHILAGGANMDQAYPGRHFVYAEGLWTCGTSAGVLGYLFESQAYQLGVTAGARFDTAFLFNDGRGGILKVAELTGLPGRGPGAAGTPTIFMSWTQDGVTWSQERAISLGALGERLKRIQWRPKTKFGNYMGLRFRTANLALKSFARLDVEVEGLNV